MFGLEVQKPVSCIVMNPVSTPESSCLLICKSKQAMVMSLPPGGRLEWNSQLPASAQHSPGCCRLLGLGTEKESALCPVFLSNKK